MALKNLFLEDTFSCCKDQLCNKQETWTFPLALYGRKNMVNMYTMLVSGSLFCPCVRGVRHIFDVKRSVGLLPAFCLTKRNLEKKTIWDVDQSKIIPYLLYIRGRWLEKKPHSIVFNLPGCLSYPHVSPVYMHIPDWDWGSSCYIVFPHASCWNCCCCYYCCCYLLHVFPKPVNDNIPYLTLYERDPFWKK